MVIELIAHDLLGISVRDQCWVVMAAFGFNVNDITDPELFWPIRDLAFYKVFIFSVHMV